MELIKKNNEKARDVYHFGDRILKRWFKKDSNWVYFHKVKLDFAYPNYVLEYGNTGEYCWMTFRLLPGVPASTFEHTPEFIDKILEFVYNLNNTTHPYVHGDWVLSNILINDNNYYICDWDNIGIYSEYDINNKIYSDLHSAFGDRFIEHWENFWRNNDRTTGI